MEGGIGAGLETGAGNGLQKEGQENRWCVILKTQNKTLVLVRQHSLASPRIARSSHVE